MTTDEEVSAPPGTQLGRRATIGLLAGTAMAAATLGRSDVASADQGQHRDEFAGSTWSMTVRFPDGLENPTYIQFSKAGEVVETNALTRSMGLGEWKRDRHGPSRYEYFFWEQIFDENDALTSVVRVAHNVSVLDSGSRLEGDGIGTVYDLAGTEVAEVATVITATRLG